MSLHFHKEIIAELCEADGLLVIARGLGLHKILLSFIRLYVDCARRKEVVFVLFLWLLSLLALVLFPLFLLFFAGLG